MVGSTTGVCSDETGALLSGSNCVLVVARPDAGGSLVVLGLSLIPLAIGQVLKGRPSRK